MFHAPAKFYRRFYGEKKVSAGAHPYGLLVSAPMAHHTNVCEFGHLVDAIFNLLI